MHHNMLLNLLTVVSALLGVVAASSYGHANPSYPAYRQTYVHRGYGYRDRDSHEDRHRWHCKKLETFRLPAATELEDNVSAPKIAYYTHQGKEMAIVVCQSPQIQVLFGKSPDANVAAGITNVYKDNALLSISTMSGLTLKCNRRERRYEAYNFITEKTVPIDKVACFTVNPAQAGTAFSSLAGLINP